MITTFPATRDLSHKWVLVDADGQVLGRLATRIALLLRGKHKVSYTPHLNVGDGVVVINAEKVKVTGQKLQQKLYRRYSGYPSGLKQETLQEVLDRHPERAIQHAVKGMLPDGPLGRTLLRRLKVYKGASHPHHAQRPEPVPAAMVGAHHG